MENQRMILLVALSFILLLLWQAWEQEYAPITDSKTTETIAQKNNQRTDVPEAPITASEAPTPLPVEAVATGPRITVTTDLISAEIDSHGGDIRRLLLLAYPISSDQVDQPFALLQESNNEGSFIAQSGLIGQEGNYPTHKVRYKTENLRYSLQPDQDTLRVPLYWQTSNGVQYVKTYVFHRNSYVIDIEYRVTNNSKKEWSGFLYGQLVRSHVEQGGLFSIPTYTGGAIYTPEDQYQKIKFADVAEQPLKREVLGGWVAILQHYFVGAWLPKSDERNQFYSEALTEVRYAMGFKNLEPTKVGPGKTGALTTSLYTGPKERKRLEQLNEGMTLTVDYGWLTLISEPLFQVLKWIHQWVGNWGWAIILLTILIKLVFYPLSATSYKSMAHMKKVQPKLQALKELHGSDRMKLNEAMMQLYRTEKINPLGGCLPILIQIPVFIALYWVLLESVEMRQAPFILWIKDLSTRDPYFVLPIIMGVSMFAQQKMNPAPIDPMQQKIFTIMPIMFTFFFMFFPAGLVLYWVVNNLLSIAQQWRITRVIEAGAK